MPERSFFNLRWVYPGFMVLLGIFIVNPVLVPNFVTIIDDNLFSGIATVVGITPFGFLAAQVWYFIFNIFRVLCPNHQDSVIYLTERIKLTGKEDQGIIRRNYKYIRMVDFLYHIKFVYENKEKETERISQYITRKWDLIHTMGSGLTSYLLAVIFSSFMRCWGWFDLPGGTNSWEYSVVYWMFTIGFIIISISQMCQIHKDAQVFITSIFREQNFQQWDVRKAFPNTCAQNKCEPCLTDTSKVPKNEEDPVHESSSRSS